MDGWIVSWEIASVCKSISRLGHCARRPSGPFSTFFPSHNRDRYKYVLRTPERTDDEPIQVQ